MLLRSCLLTFFALVYSSPSSKLIKGTEPLICGLHEVATDCVEPCLPTCDNPKTPPCTFKLCLGGCICEEGYIRETASRGRCVKVESCVDPGDISRNYTIPRCEERENEVLSDCASNCQPFCDRTDVSGCTKLYCSRGCVCKQGYIRKEEGGTCILSKNC